jgi:hypothetical protein
MSLEQSTIEQLRSTMTIDLTTIGRTSGQPRTIEIWWFHVEGRFIITGTPGPRDWLANVRSEPTVVITSPHGEFHGTAIEIADPIFKRAVFTHPDIGWYQTQAQLDDLVETAPMIEVDLLGPVSL